MRTTDELSGQNARGLAVLEDDLSVFEGGFITCGVLQQAFSARREIIDDLGDAKAEVVVVDDVDIGEVSRGKDAAIFKAVESGCLTGLAHHHVFDREFFAAFAVTSPMSQHKRGHPCVTDRATVGASVA